MMCNLFGKCLWFQSHFYPQFSARLAPVSPDAKSFTLEKSLGWTDGSWLKLQSRGWDLGFETKSQKFCFGLFLGECLREMPRQMGDSRFCTLWRFLLTSNWFGDNNSPVKQKEWDDRVADRLSQPRRRQTSAQTVQPLSINLRSRQ